MYGPHRLDLQVIGDEGSLHLMPDHLLFQKRGGRTREKIPLSPETDHGVRGPARGIETAVVRMYQDFLNAVRKQQRPFVTPEMASVASAVAFLAERSAHLGRSVAWAEPA